jgi:CTLH/CRA C-terminal to LisH motif domain
MTCGWHHAAPPWHCKPPALCCAQILEEHAELTFHLQQQRLIELIRGGDADAALAFAQDILAPLGEEHPAFLAELGEPPLRPAHRECVTTQSACAASSRQLHLMFACRRGFMLRTLAPYVH